MTEVEDVLDALNGVIDPCSRAIGVPAGLVEMGLVSEVRVTQGEHGLLVEATISATEPACMMIAVFATEAKVRLMALPDVSKVDITLGYSSDWSEAQMEPGYHKRLSAARDSRRPVPLQLRSRT